MLHFPNVEKAIAEMFRVVRPGGTVVVSFGAGHPLRGKGLVRHKIKRVAQVMQHKCIFAPAFLCNLAAKKLGRGHADGVLTAWSKHQPDRHIIRKMRSAGFRNVELSWHGHDVEFASPNLYWEAQIAIVTDVRKRLEKADPSIEAQLKTDFLSEAKRVVASGGKLLYPYGAVFIKATRPL
jgi:SAM-dependent methyltransferase